MDTITVICTVAADFFAPGGLTFSIESKDRNTIKEAPAWIKNTLMFKYLRKDRSISFVDKNNKKQAENDPLAGQNAEGKRIPLMTVGGQEQATEAKTADAEVQPKKRAPRKKKDDAE